MTDKATRSCMSRPGCIFAFSMTGHDRVTSLEGAKVSRQLLTRGPNVGNQAKKAIDFNDSDLGRSSTVWRRRGGRIKAFVGVDRSFASSLAGHSMVMYDRPSQAP